VLQKVERFEVPPIEQPPVNPLENEMVLESKAPHATVVSAGAVIVGKAAGLIVVIVLKPQLKHDHNCLLPSKFRLLFIHTHLVLQKSRRFEVPLIKQPPVNH
jgi:hypothetical protein